MIHVPFSEIEHLKKRAHTLRLGLNQRLEEVFVSDYPTDSPHALIHLIQNILGKISVEIDNTDNSETLILICQLIQFYGEFLQFLDNANTEQTPRGLVQILENIYLKISPDSQLLAWPQADYNYSIINLLPILKESIENLISKKERDEIFEGFSSDLNLISFPRIERDDILVHAIFGHEIGHPIADQFLSSEEWGDKSDEFQKELESASEKLLKELEKDLENKETEYDKTRAKQFLIKSLIDIRKRGMEELISDCVSVMIFGPSALFAFYDVLVPDGLDNPPMPNEYYPPSRYRLRIAWRIMNEFGYHKELIDMCKTNCGVDSGRKIQLFIEHLEKLVEVESDVETLNEIPVLRVSYEWIDKVIDKAIIFSKECITEIIYPSELIKKEVPGLLERISLGLPPNEIGMPSDKNIVDWRSAILASWIYKIIGLKITGSGTENINSKDIDRLQSITLKAIEYIMLQNKYRSHMNSVT